VTQRNYKTLPMPAHALTSTRYFHSLKVTISHPTEHKQGLGYPSACDITSRSSLPPACVSIRSSRLKLNVKFSPVLAKHIKASGAVEVHFFHSFLTSVLEEGDWSASHPDRFTPGTLGRKLGGPQRIREKSFVPSGNRNLAGQLVISQHAYLPADAKMF
jgi:hypothetical protein